MQPSKLYCPNCKVHTMHVHMVEMYATRCLKCNCYTSQLERAHTENLQFKQGAIEGKVVNNTPDSVTFYVEKGEHKGYYEYDKHTKKKEIRRT